VNRAIELEQSSKKQNDRCGIIFAIILTEGLTSSRRRNPVPLKGLPVPPFLRYRHRNDAILNKDVESICNEILSQARSCTRTCFESMLIIQCISVNMKRYRIFFDIFLIRIRTSRQTGVPSWMLLVRRKFIKKANISIELGLT